MFLMVDYSKVLWSFVQELQQTLSQMVFLKNNIFDCFVVDSSHLGLTFEALYLYTPPPPPKKKIFHNSGLKGKKRLATLLLKLLELSTTFYMSHETFYTL